MADRKVQLEVIITDKGTLKVVSKDVKGVKKETDKASKSFNKMSNAANKTKRNLEGVANRANNTGKDFSRMSQGMGGLVQAYATIAANVFALSSAFLVLRRAADLSSMMKSAEDFSNRFGVSVTRLTKRMQELSGGALDFAEALPSINKAVSAGVGIEQMEKLTVAATKASQTFGGSTAEALNRFISASQRGRVEIIQTLGVVIKTEQAYKDYAARIGKTAQELTAFDRQQAILNATIEESEKVFGAINIDPNPFTQLATTIVDLKNKYLTTITDAITPSINIFNRSAEAARAFMLVIGSAVAGRIFPQLTVLLKGVQQASIQSTANAARAQRAALDLRAKAAAEHAKKVGVISQKGLRKQIKQEEAAYAERDRKHAAFQQSIFDREGRINRARLTAQRAALQKQLNDIEKRGGKGSTDMLSRNPKILREQIRIRDSLTSSTQNLGIAEAKNTAARDAATTKLKKHTAAWKAYSATVKATATSIKSNLVTGFSKGFATAQQSVIKGTKLMIRDWRLFNRVVGTDGPKSLKYFSNAFGRTVGTIAGGLAKLASAATSLLLVWSLYNLAVEIFGDKIKGITPEQRKLLDTFQDSGEALQEITERNKDFIAGFDSADDTLAGFIKTTEFLRGTMDSLKTTFNDVTIAFNRAFGTTRSTELTKYIEEIEAVAAKADQIRAEVTQKNAAGIEARAQAFDALDVGGRVIPKESREALKAVPEDMTEIVESSEAAARTLKNVNNIIDEMGKTFIPQLIAGLSSTNALLKDTGFSNAAKTIRDDIANAVKNYENAPAGLAEALSKGDFITAQGILKDIQGQSEQGAKDAAILLGLITEAGAGATEAGLALFNNFVGFSKSLQTVNSNMGTYLAGIEKAKAASVPNKEVINFIIDSRVALEGLAEQAKEAGGNLKQIVQAKDLKTLRLFFDIPESVTTYAKALEYVKEEQEAYNRVIQDSITKSNVFKSISNEVAKLKAEEASTDERRLEIIERLNQLEVDKLEEERRRLENQRDAAQRDLNRLIRVAQQNNTDLNSIAIQNAKATVDGLELEITANENLTETVKKRLDYEREVLEIRKESIDSLKGINAAEQRRLKIAAGLTGSLEQYLKITQNIYTTQKRSLDLQKQEIERKIDLLDVNGETAEQDRKQLAVYNAQLETLRLQRIELERAQESRLAQELEHDGTTIFSEDGIRATAHFFKRALEEEIPKLKSTFELLGKGLSKTLLDTFDLMVDNLLEGGRDFAKTVREGLKASLRDVFGNVLKNKIKEAFVFAAEKIGVFDKLFPKEAQEKQDKELDRAAREATSEYQAEMKRQAAEHTRLLTIISQKSPATQGTGFLPAPEGGPLASAVPPAAGTGGGLSALQGIAGVIASPQQMPGGNAIQEVAGILQDQTKLMEKPPAVPLSDGTVGQINEAPGVLGGLGMLGNVVSMVGQDSKAGIIGALISMTTQLVSALYASGVFGAAGGIAPGGFRALADGGVVNKPTLGLIGEGSRNEAVVPLPNNREIPVELKGGGETVNINMNQSFDFTNSSPETVAQLRAEARMIEERTFNRVFGEINKGGKYAKMVGRR